MNNTDIQKGCQVITEQEPAKSGHLPSGKKITNRLWGYLVKKDGSKTKCSGWIYTTKAKAEAAAKEYIDRQKEQ